MSSDVEDTIKAGRSMQWEADPPDCIHVEPIEDLVGHDTSTTEPDCLCGPELEPVKRDNGSIGYLIIHHSLDGRELSEVSDE